MEKKLPKELLDKFTDLNVKILEYGNTVLAENKLLKMQIRQLELEIEEYKTKIESLQKNHYKISVN